MGHRGELVSRMLAELGLGDIGRVRRELEKLPEGIIWLIVAKP